MENKLEKIILELLKSNFQNGFDLNCFKRKMAKKYGITCPKNIALLKAYHKLLQEKRIKQNEGIEQALKTRPVRSLSGIVNVSLLTKPWPCKGKCLFCPQQKGLPKSYLKEEPACQRAILTKFSPKKQVLTRLLSLELTGHPIDKIELRIIGGTWHYYPLAYRKWFIKQCYKTCNNFSLPPFKRKRLLNNLKQEQKRNETAKARIIGITIETRPDCVDKKAIQEMRELGITRVELGVQSIFDDVLQINQRGHSVADIAKATLLLKEAGFKVSYQLMPNLPKSNPKRDLLLFKEVFQNPSFRPDLIKIYPLALLKNTGVYRLYQKNKFKPYTEKQLLKLLIALKKEIPLWCRIERVIRDIPKKYIVEGGAQISNLRELVQEGLKKEGAKCKCIRCREVGTNYSPKDKLYLFKEVFQNPSFKPDLIKIYPLALLKNTGVYKLYQKGQFKPYTEKQLIALLKSAKKKVPYYCRIQRLTRDIPSPSIVVGPAKISNMRQILARGSKEENWHCKCIRCREVGKNYRPKEKLYLFRKDYDASDGKEIFLSYESKNRERLYSLLRLRIPSKENVILALKDVAIIREVHTYGQLHSLGGKSNTVSPQHKGLGKKLIRQAEKITKKEFSLKKLAVISGIGVRGYYRKLGYELDGTYMVKYLRSNKKRPDGPFSV